MIKKSTTNLNQNRVLFLSLPTPSALPFGVCAAFLDLALGDESHRGCPAQRAGGGMGREGVGGRGREGCGSFRRLMTECLAMPSLVVREHRVY
jgi:hypothetical protein